MTTGQVSPCCLLCSAQLNSRQLNPVMPALADRLCAGRAGLSSCAVGLLYILRSLPLAAAHAPLAAAHAPASHQVHMPIMRCCCRALREADSQVSSKQGEFDRVVPMIKKHDQAMHGLADEYDSAMGKSRAVHEDADRLRALAAEDETARSRLASLIEELMEKLRLAGESAACSCSPWCC